MKSQVVRWGNSLALRIPKDVLEKAALQEGDILELGAKKGAIVAKVVKRRPTLGELVEQITPENRPSPANAHAPQGCEEW